MGACWPSGGGRARQEHRRGPDRGACLEQGVPLVARGAGTGLSGGANAVEGSVILALDGMDRVLEVDELERLAVVQPGVVNDDLRAQVAALGLWYPPDPASSPWSSRPWEEMSRRTPAECAASSTASPATMSSLWRS
ncbi:FAD-binding protein [Streptomyces sp. NBC_00264]|uniref:FAD-binding oxidoreductase n=1 Tax=unclassified Streptomyces TaxID=2593676 RepID=UPI00224E7AC5|nr:MULTISPECIES: FAD-binding protein [unclassified Streptomyces]MCX5166176.1 FAD-binding protein [Streptomyces sp. NBC_00305]MCX5224693.1 FAD-binding protein [Streptomyces sp. NBC_00264]